MKKSGNALTGYLLILPAVIILLMILVYPLFYSLYLSFYKVRLSAFNIKTFVGLKNYVKVFTNTGPNFFKQILPATIYFVGASIILQLVLGMGMALLVNQKWVKGREIFRAIFILPWVTSAIVIAISWRFMYEPRLGILNYFLINIGVKNLPSWLNDLNLVVPCLVVANVWHGTSFSFIMETAGLQSISYTLYEAATVDGAGSLNRFRYITLPLLRPFILINLILISMYTINVFDLIYAMTGGGPLYRSEVISLFMYHQAFEYGHMGFGAAIAIIILFINLVLTSFYMVANRGETEAAG